jgi:Na+/citrate or Na+/malate symporter
MLLPPAAGQTASFITVFLAILMAYIFFVIVFASALLSGKVPQRIYGPIEIIIIAGIVLGVVGMFQPWLQLGFQVGFYLLLASTLSFIVWSHITPRAARYEEEEVGKTLPGIEQ